jgi:hypothetical protein
MSPHHRDAEPVPTAGRVWLDWLRRTQASVPPRPSKRAAVAAAFRPVAGAAVAALPAAAQGGAPPAPPSVAAPLSGTAPQREEHSARTEPSAPAEARPRVAGHVGQVHSYDGAARRAGYVLFTLDRHPSGTAFESARATGSTHPDGADRGPAPGATAARGRGWMRRGGTASATRATSSARRPRAPE